jgi:hypothetical protein
VKGRIWLWGGAALGVAVALGRVPYLAGAARSLAFTAERLVLSGAHRVVAEVAKSGAPQRVVVGLGGVVAAAAPGLAALALVAAAVGSLRLRAVIAVLLAGLGAASYAYLPHGDATGVLLLVMALAGLAVALTGPLVAAPLAMAAGLLGAEFLPALVASHTGLGQGSVNAVHLAIYNRPGTPLVLQVGLLLLALAPFAIAGRLLIRS